jgi:hypothetical protein
MMGTEGLKNLSQIQITFRQKAVYYYWNILVQDKWRQSDDPLESAIQYMQTEGEGAFIEEMKDVIPQPGTHVLAFSVKDLVMEWGSHTQELGLDSTCKSAI